MRDASLSLALLARLGKVDEVEHYFDWLCSLGSVTKAPLQVCYRFDGKTQLEPVELSAVRGYLDSRPVRYGNRVAKQRQLGSLGFFADCARIYVEHGGRWQDKHWQLLRRVADYTSTHWHLPESGIWELSVEAHYVASKAMCWVVLERALQIARLTGRGEDGEIRRWSSAAKAIHALAKTGRIDEAEAILKRCEAMAGELGLFAEEADGRTRAFLGNTPLLFSQVEYVRAALGVAQAHCRAKNARREKTHEP